MVFASSWRVLSARPIQRCVTGCFLSSVLFTERLTENVVAKSHKTVFDSLKNSTYEEMRNCNDAKEI